MRQTKRTYTLPAETLGRFETQVAPGRRSQMVGQLILQWLDETERERLRQEVIEGCRDMEQLYRDVAREWSPVDEEAWRAVEWDD
jgi:hypothetical protein